MAEGYAIITEQPEPFLAEESVAAVAVAAAAVAPAAASGGGAGGGGGAAAAAGGAAAAATAAPDNSPPGETQPPAQDGQLSSAAPENCESVKNEGEDVAAALSYPRTPLFQIPEKIILHYFIILFPPQ